MSEFTRITVPLSREEFARLQDVAIQEYRHPRDQARYIIRSVLLGESPPSVIATNEKSAVIASTGNGALVGIAQ